MCKTLIARWSRMQDYRLEDPSSVVWDDGHPATFDDYKRHRADTREWVKMPDVSAGGKIGHRAALCGGVKAGHRRILVS